MEHQTGLIELCGGSKLLVINLPAAVSFSFDVYVRSGYRFASPEQYELPHLLEHLAFEGNRKYPDALAFKTEIERDGAYFNASTNSSYNQYEFVSLPQELRRIVELGLAQVFEPILAPQSIANEKEVIRNELSRNRENFARKRWYSLEQSIVGSRALPDLSARIACLSAITADDLRSYHQKRYQSQNINFVISGSFSESELQVVVDLINQSLAKIPMGPVLPYAPFALNQQRNRLVSNQIPVQDQAYFMIKFLRPQARLDDVAPLSLLATIYNGGFSSRMMIKARRLGLTYGLGTAVRADLDYTSFSIFDQTRPEKLIELFRLAMAELIELKNGKYSTDELERARGYEIGGFRRGYQTPVQYADWYGEDFLYGRELTSPEQHIERLQAVDRESISAAATSYLTKSNWSMSLLVKQPATYTNQLQAIIDDVFEA